MEIPPHPPLVIEITLGDYRDVFTLDAGLLAEGRELELQRKLTTVPTAIEFLARRAGLRPGDDAHFDCVVAYHRAVERGDETEAARLRVIVER